MKPVSPGLSQSIDDGTCDFSVVTLVIASYASSLFVHYTIVYGYRYHATWMAGSVLQFVLMTKSFHSRAYRSAKRIIFIEAGGSCKNKDLFLLTVSSTVVSVPDPWRENIT